MMVGAVVEKEVAEAEDILCCILFYYGVGGNTGQSERRHGNELDKRRQN